MTENYRGFCIRPLSESYELDKKTIDKLLDCLNTKDLIEDNDFQLTIKAYHASMNMSRLATLVQIIFDSIILTT